MSKKIGTVIILTGVIMIIAAAVLAGFNVAESSRAALRAELLSAELSASLENQSADDMFLADISDGEMKIETVGGTDLVGMICIPSVGIELPVINAWSYDNLKISACRYSGTPEENNFIILAHNYTRHFGRLRRANVGDEVVFTDNFGKTQEYSVEKVETLGAYELKRLTENEYDLTLFTCTYGGRSRTVVRCGKRG